jgi:esterase/lipase superfamily enzyme
MQWQRMHAQVKKHSDAPAFDKTKCIVQDTVLSRDEIVPAFEAYRKNVDSKENIIYVHGCCANFDTVMSRAAMVASHTQAPVLVYDWVSPHGFINYLVNETMITQTVDDFCKFINKVETLMDPREITFIGHSMGAQLVDHAMVRRADLMKANPSMSKFKELIMSNADIDVLSFIKHGNDFSLNGEKTRIYFSTKDKRLRLSRFVHGGFDRLGAPGSSISELIKIKGTECIDITENNTGHDLPYWIVSNMHRYNGVGPAQGFELKKRAPGYLLLVRSSIAYQEINETHLKCACAPKVIQ